MWVLVKEGICKSIFSGSSLSSSNYQTSSQKPITSSQNRKLALININGVLYKSSNNKLQKSVPTPKKQNKTAIASASNGEYPNERSLYVRGEKFVLDSTGTRLRRVSESSTLKLSRIDIGRLTYKAAQNGGFVRDNSNSVRTHLR